MRYAEPEDVGREALERARVDGAVEGTCAALIGLVSHDEDGKWLQDTCMSMLDHDAVEVRKCAVIGLGHIARIHRALDTDLLLPALQALRDDPDVGGAVADALDDISVFLPDSPPEI